MAAGTSERAAACAVAIAPSRGEGRARPGGSRRAGRGGWGLAL